MLPENFIEHIVGTLYAQECITGKPDPEWFDTTLREVKAFLRLQMLFGIKQLPATSLEQ